MTSRAQEDRGQEHWLDADGFEVHAVTWRSDEWGNGDARILLVHGLGGHTISWEPSASGLAEQLHATVTAVDLPGFGLTRLPRGRRATLGTHGRVLRALLEQWGPAAVAGNSMGGALGIGLAARHPELVRALVLVDPALPRPAMNPAQWTVMARLAPMLVPRVGAQFLAARGRVLGPERLVDDTMAWTLCDPSRLDPELRRRLVELARTRRGFPEAPAAYAHSARALFWYLTRNMRADEARVTSPTLIVHGDRDQLVPAAAARTLAARRPEFALELIDDCGHAPQLEVPDQFLAAVVPWLASTLTAGR
jgi:pimeloyl-ACP methyl ester carboxylesterase